jgi:HAE1 family hydrophobic/amphiphilic exporter-1
MKDKFKAVIAGTISQVRRFIDESSQIKHSARLMDLKQLIYAALFCGAALGANAQPVGTVQPPQTSTNALPAEAPPVSAIDQPENRTNRSLTLDECIRLALKNNLDIQIQEEAPVINRYLLNVNYGVYEPVLTFSASKSYNDQPGGLDPQTQTPYNGSATEQNNYSPGIQGVLPTGLTYDLSGTFTRNSVLNPGPPPHYNEPFYTADQPGPGITLTQPLLKNLWIDRNRELIQLSKVALKTSVTQLSLQIMTSVTAVKTAYFNLLYARGNVEANATAYKLAQQLVTENVKRVEVGALAPLDEKQSEAQAASSLAAMHVAEQQLIVQENALKNLLTDNYSEWANVTLLPSEQLMAVPQTLDLQESWRKAVTDRPELIEAKQKVESQNITLKYDFNQRFPELDITGSYGRNANGASAGAAFDELRRGDASYYSYGAFVSIPLGGNFAAKNQYKSDKGTLKQLLLSLKQVEQGIIVAVDNDVGAVRSTLQQVYATRDARVYAQEALDAEKKKLENGKSTSFVVLQLISNLTTARVNEVQALANYNVALAQLSLDQGTTLTDNNIDLNIK